MHHSRPEIILETPDSEIIQGFNQCISKMLGSGKLQMIGNAPKLTTQSGDTRYTGFASYYSLFSGDFYDLPADTCLNLLFGDEKSNGCVVYISGGDQLTTDFNDAVTDNMNVANKELDAQTYLKPRVLVQFSGGNVDLYTEISKRERLIEVLLNQRNYSLYFTLRGVFVQLSVEGDQLDYNVQSLYGRPLPDTKESIFKLFNNFFVK